jgi:transcription elongation factor Elf1
MAEAKFKSGAKSKSGAKPKVTAKPKNTAKPKSTVKPKSKAKSTKVAALGVTFKCRLCEKQKPISEMKIIKRFRPVIFVCHECEKVFQ